MATKKKTPTKKKTSRAAKRAPSTKVLVTGATGFLGRYVVEQLIEQGYAVRALVRHPTLALERSGVDIVRGDVTDASACATACKGVSSIIHAAGLVSRLADDAPAMYRVHVEGTRALLEAAAKAKVGRVVVVSTSGTVAVSKDADEISDEHSPYRQALVSRWPYYLSKIYQEQTAFEMGERLGLDVVVVNPSLLLGPGDTRGSSTGDVERVARGRVPVIPKGGGVAFVDARDAAAGCILALERGTRGERYLLSAANMTLEAFMGRVARLAQVPAPRAVLAPQTMRLASRLTEALYKQLQATPPIDVQSVEMAQHTWYVDASKAKEQLGWTHREPMDTLSDTVMEIQRRRGKVPARDDATHNQAQTAG